MSKIDQLSYTFNMIRDALLSNDIQMLKKLIAEEYIGYDPQGNPQDLQMTLEAYQPGAVKLNRFDAEGIKARMIGDVGIITGLGYIQGIFANCEFEHRLRFLDLYIFRDDRWQLFLSQVTPTESA